jgi:hypothetical protein
VVRSGEGCEARGRGLGACAIARAFLWEEPQWPYAWVKAARTRLEPGSWGHLKRSEGQLLGVIAAPGLFKAGSGSFTITGNASNI